MTDGQRNKVFASKMEPEAVSSGVPLFITTDVSDQVRQSFLQAGIDVQTFAPKPFRATLKSGRGPFPVIWSPPSDQVANALTSGMDPAPILSDWLKRHQALLALFRKNRRKVRLVDARALFQDDDDQLEPLKTLIELDTFAPIPRLSSANDSPLASLLASLAVPSLARLQDCLNELQASSITPEQDVLSMADLRSVLPEFEQVRQLASEAADRDRRLQDTTTALEAAQATIESLTTRLATQEQEAQAAQEAAQEKQDALQLLSDRQAEEIALMRQQMEVLLADGAGSALEQVEEAEQHSADLQKALDAAQKQALDVEQRLTAQVTALKDDLRKRDSEIELLRGQYSVHLDQAASAAQTEDRPEPVVIEQVQPSTLKEAFPTEAAEMTRLQTEVALLRDQLHLGLSEAERLNADYAEKMAKQEASYNQARAETERAFSRTLKDYRDEARERRALQKRLGELQERLATLRYERNAFESAVNDMYASRSWRITKPLRQIRTFLVPLKAPDDQNGTDSQA